MSQQLGIILMVDVESALAENTLEGNTYLYDNMKLQGSEGLGTGKLVSAINGTCWSDGSQANEQVLNWLPYGVGSLPPSIPKNFRNEQARTTDTKTIEEIKALADKQDQFKDVASLFEELKRISSSVGTTTQISSKYDDVKHDLGTSGCKILDVTGKVVEVSEDKVPDISSLNPIITDITGEAVDKNIIYPAAYGSPDMVTDGWYWAASVDTSRPGTYAYTMHVQLYKLSFIDGSWTWKPVDMTCEAYLRITKDPKVNGFTGSGMGYIPVPMV